MIVVVVVIFLILAVFIVVALALAARWPRSAHFAPRSAHQEPHCGRRTAAQVVVQKDVNVDRVRAIMRIVAVAVRTGARARTKVTRSARRWWRIRMRPGSARSWLMAWLRSEIAGTARPMTWIALRLTVPRIVEVEAAARTARPWMIGATTFGSAIAIRPSVATTPFATAPVIIAPVAIAPITAIILAAAIALVVVALGNSQFDSLIGSTHRPRGRPLVVGIVA